MNPLSGRTLINVDIQPEYQGAFGFDIEDWAAFLNRSFMDLHNNVFLYNGTETVGEVTKETYIYWLYDKGVSEEVVDGSTFYDKGYAYFRYCMDVGIDEDAIVNFVRFMYQNDITDSRDLNREMWAKYLRLHRKTDKRELYDLLKVSGDCVNIPDLMEFIKRYQNITLTGGGMYQCLKEVEIALKSLGKGYDVFSRFVY